MPIDSMMQVLSPFHLLKHPFYQDWMAGKLSTDQLQDYAAQYSVHVEAFPRYLSAIHSNCENAEQRKLLLENLNDEEGSTPESSHPHLWKQFAAGVGVTSSQLESALPRTAIQNVIATFFKFTRSSFHEGLGAIYAYESQIPEIAESKIEGLKNFYSICDEQTLRFFEVHKTADIYHRQAIEKILSQLSPEQLSEATAAAKTTAEALWSFLTDVHRQTQNIAS